jgi:hypothetical protein
MSATEATVKTLEFSADSLSLYLVLWTALVVVGLVFEYIPEILSAIKIQGPIWTHRIVSLGAICITLGVAGELYVEFRARHVEEQLRTANDEIFANLAKVAADVTRDAGVANSKAGEANDRAANLEVDAAKLRERAATAELALLKLKQDTGPRQPNWGKFADRLKLGPKGRVTIRCGQQVEPCQLATGIFGFMTLAMWDDARIEVGLVFQGIPATELIVFVNDWEHPPPHAIALQDALRLSGLKSFIAPTPGLGSDDVILLVGSKAVPDK